MREIPLGNGRGVALVDDEDYEALIGYRWRFNRKFGYALRHGANGSTVYMHRTVAKATTGILVDHINGNGLDNRRGNLRLCTCSQNCANARKRRTHGYKGVMPFPGFWRAQVGGDKATYHKTEMEAALEYDRRARVRFGAFARLNFPRDGEQAA